MIKKAEQYKNFVFLTAMEIWKENFFEEGKLQTVKAMKEDGLSLEKISQYTGLPLEKIKKI